MATVLRKMARSLLVTSCCLAGASAASAQAFVEASAGAGWTSGHFRFRRGTVIANEGPAGPAFDLALGLGVPLSRTFALGVRGEAELDEFELGADAVLPHAAVNAALLGAIGVSAALRFAPGIELSGDASWARAGFYGVEDDIGGPDSYNFESASGPAFGLWLGWRARNGLGLGVRNRLALLSGAYTDYRPLAFLLSASWSGWR